MGVAIQRDPGSGSGRLSEAEALWPRRCRRIIRAVLQHWRQPSLVENAELLTSELVTNALRHGTGPDIGMRLYISGTHVVIEVRDGTPDLPVLREAKPDDEDGRGLALVDAVADAWGTSPDGARTWCSLPLCKGPDSEMQSTPAPVLRQYPPISLPGDPSAVSRARTLTRSGLTVIGWLGDVHAATEVVAHLVENAVAYGVMPDFVGEGVAVVLCIDDAGQLVVDVTDPNPKFPGFEEALQERGHSLCRIKQHGAKITWFMSSGVEGKTVRVTMTPGPVAL